MSICSGLGFILSYFYVGFSKPGIARSKGPTDAKMK